MTEGHGRDWVEIAATVLLAIAAVATAWSSYQATRWNGEQAKTSGSVNKTRIEAARAADLSNAQKQVDVATFMQWVDAYANGETELVNFYRARFRDEFKPAFNAWVATKPLQTAGAPPTPFALPAVPAGRGGRGRSAGSERGRADCPGAPEHPAGVQLRSRRRSLRRRAVLRGDEHEAQCPCLTQDDARGRLPHFPGRRGLDRDVSV